MKLFSFFRKPKAPPKMVDQTETIVYDFMLRTPYWSYRPVTYREHESFVNLKPVLDSYLDQLFKGSIDAGNGNILDSFILNTARQAQEDLARQHTDHKNTITQFFIRNQGDQEAFSHQITLLRDELADNEAKQTEIKARLNKNTFLGGINDA